MSHLDFFKRQAKNLLKDWQTQTKTVGKDGFISYHYDWKFFDVGDLFFYYEFDDKDEQDIKLARAQHLIAKMVGFKKWNDLIQASEIELELAELLLRRFKTAQDVQEWDEALLFAGVAQYGTEAVLEYARQFYQLGNAKELVHFPEDKITVLSGNLRTEALNQFERGIIPQAFPHLNLDTKVHCIHCGKEFLFNEANVVVFPDSNEACIQCKQYPECNGTLIDMIPVHNAEAR